MNVQNMAKGMNDVQRFDFERGYDGYGYVDPDGSYVLYTDYAALQQQLAAAREVVDHARLAEFHFSQWEDGQFPGEKAHSLKYLRGEMEALRAALATLQRDRQP